MKRILIVTLFFNLISHSQVNKLNEVVINTKKKDIKLDGNKLTFYPNGKESNVSELINKIPLLNITNNILTIEGKKNVLLYINGKKQYLSPGMILKKISPKNIRKLEIKDEIINGQNTKCLYLYLKNDNLYNFNGEVGYSKLGHHKSFSADVTFNKNFKLNLFYTDLYYDMIYENSSKVNHNLITNNPVNVNTSGNKNLFLFELNSSHLINKNKRLDISILPYHYNSKDKDTSAIINFKNYSVINGLNLNVKQSMDESYLNISSSIKINDNNAFSNNLNNDFDISYFNEKFNKKFQISQITFSGFSHQYNSIKNRNYNLNFYTEYKISKRNKIYSSLSTNGFNGKIVLLPTLNYSYQVRNNKTVNIKYIKNSINPTVYNYISVNDNLFQNNQDQTFLNNYLNNSIKSKIELSFQHFGKYSYTKFYIQSIKIKDKIYLNLSKKKFIFEYKNLHFTNELHGIGFWNRAKIIHNININHGGSINLNNLGKIKELEYIINLDFKITKSINLNCKGIINNGYNNYKSFSKPINFTSIQISKKITNYFYFKVILDNPIASKEINKFNLSNLDFYNKKDYYNTALRFNLSYNFIKKNKYEITKFKY